MAVIAFEAHGDDREIVRSTRSEHIFPGLPDQRQRRGVLRDQCAPGDVSQHVMNTIAAKDQQVTVLKLQRLMMVSTDAKGFKPLRDACLLGVELVDPVSGAAVP